jgi:hypothetical protein
MCVTASLNFVSNSIWLKLIYVPNFSQHSKWDSTIVNKSSPYLEVFTWNSLHCFLYRIGTGHPQRTQLFSNGYHVLLSGMSPHALPSNGCPIIVHSLLWYVFTGLLLSNGRPSVVGWAFVGTCLPVRLSLSVHHHSFFSEGCTCNVCSQSSLAATILQLLHPLPP